MTLSMVKVEDPCACGDEMPVDMCCKTEIKTLQLDDNQKATATTICELHDVAIDIIASFTIPTLNGDCLTDVAITSSPPQHNELHILNSVFLI